MASFKDLGLREELLSALEEREIGRPTALQTALIPMLRRGNNAIARASTGAGKTLAYGLGVLDRVQSNGADEANDDAPEGDSPDAASLRMLVLTATPEAAERVALELVPFAQSIGATVAVAGGRWRTPVMDSEVVLGTPIEVLAAVQGSAVKLERLESLVVDGASDIYALGQAETLEALTDLLPRDAQRVLLSAAFPDPVEDFVARRVKRALRFPAEPAFAETAEVAPSEGVVAYATVSEAEKLPMLLRILDQTRSLAEGAPAVWCRTDERAAELAEALTQRGYLVGDAEDQDADLMLVTSETTREELGAPGARTVSYDVPPDPETLRARHLGDPGVLVLIEPRELPHIREIAGRAHLAPQPVAIPVPQQTLVEVAAFRDQIRRAVREQDLAAAMLMLEPLFEELGPAEVAAAATALLRSRPSAVSSSASAAPSSPGRTVAARPAVRAEAGPPPAPPSTYARLYIGVGERDGVRPADLVGAIAGEAEIRGAQVGRIEIRDTFSLVEVDAGVADQVIRALNGTTIKNRSVRVDFDRGADRAARSRGEGGGPRERPGARPGGPPRRDGGDRPPRRDDRPRDDRPRSGTTGRPPRDY